MRIEQMKDRLGLAFFTFAAVVSALAAWEQPTILAWLAGLHNAILAALYARRKPASSYDHRGLWLGILAAVLPLAAPYPAEMPVLVLTIGLLGYGLVLWSLLALGSSFGIAPADRGLVTRGPYGLVRHPMYLGELILRAALVVSSPQLVLAGTLLIALIVIQIIRALREERIINTYDAYASRVRYRLIPGVW
jgi:protein-S-isoprenylcysteine O-methyltransferase Ste14